MTSLLLFLLSYLLQITNTTPATSKFYVPLGTSQGQKPMCLGIDSQFTYLCTDNAAVAGKALGLQDRGTFINDKNLANLGVSQRLSGSEMEILKVKQVMAEMLRYMDEEVMSRSEYEHVRGSCRNEHELCAFWTSVGECESNRVFMLQNCAAACRLCLLQATNMDMFGA